MDQDKRLKSLAAINLEQAFAFLFAATNSSSVLREQTDEIRQPYMEMLSWISENADDEAVTEDDLETIEKYYSLLAGKI